MVKAMQKNDPSLSRGQAMTKVLDTEDGQAAYDKEA